MYWAIDQKYPLYLLADKSGSFRQHFHDIHSLMRPILFLLTAGMLACGSAWTQERSHLQFTTKDGLPGDNIYSIVQDKDGFIWIATETGLSRFDGKTFKNFTVKDGLPGNEITSLFVDHANRLWIVPFESEPCFYYKGRIYRRGNSRLLDKFPEHERLVSIAEDAAGRLFAEFPSRYILTDAHDSCTLLPRPLKHNGFFRPLRGFHAFPKDAIAPDLIAAGDTSVSECAINFYNNKAVAHSRFFATKDAVSVYHPDERIMVIPIPPNTYSLYPINDSILIFNSRNGSYVFDAQTGRLLERFLQGYWVNHTYFDEEGGIWVGTYGSGLFYFPAGSGMSVPQTPAGTPLQLRNFYPIEDELIAGTNNGTFWKIDKQTHAVHAGPVIRQLSAKVLHTVSGNSIRPFAKELLGIPELRHRLADIDAVKSFARVGDTSIVATFKLVKMFSAGNSGTEIVLWNGRATSALKWHDHYYVGTLKGLYCFPAGNNLPHKPANSTLLLNGIIGSMAFTANPDMLWVTTSDNGVYCIAGNNRVIHNFNADIGLSANICNCLFTDGRRVFVGTNNGLNVIVPSDSNILSPTRYYTLDGLISNDISCIYAEGSRVWVGTPAGYSYIDINESKPLQSYCRFNITEILVSGKSLPLDTNYLTLQPIDNNIEIRFSGISFRSMDRMKYTYRLNGLGQDWQHTSQNYLRYPSLPAGDYRLEIYATNRYGRNSSTKVFSFTIREPWWRHWWIQAAGVVLLLGMIASALWWRHARMRRREQERAALRAQITDLEQMALRAQMNPHFIFNSLNSFYQYVIHKDLAGASKFMGNFSTLLRLMFEITMQKEITLDKELLFLRTYMEVERTKLRERFDYTIDVAEDILSAEEILIPTFIIQPFIENSIRHGIASLRDRKGHIFVSFSRVEHELMVCVADNGIGRRESAAQKEKSRSIHQSKGMALTGERILLYNKSNATNVRFEVMDTVPEGTVVVIHFPL